MERLDAGKRLWKEMAALLPPKQRRRFWLVLLILGVSAVLSQITPLAVAGSPIISWRGRSRALGR